MKKATSKEMAFCLRAVACSYQILATPDCTGWCKAEECLEGQQEQQ